MGSRPTWAEIDLSAIRYNLRQIKKLTGKRRGVCPKIMAVVKANAYGHGLIEVARTLEKSDVHYLGVATLDEAVLLRRQGIKLPVLVLGLVLKDELDYALDHDIALTVCSTDLARSLNNKAKARDRSAPVHIKIDTGMGRIGLWHKEAFDVLKKIAQMKHIKMEGIYTHFADASRDNTFTEYQLKSFEKLLQELAGAGICFDYRHAANSIALIELERSHFNLVRPGIIVYGMYPKRNFSKKLNLKAALSLKTRIVYLKHVPAGRSLSYGRTFITKKATCIATLPIGYADGYGRILSNRAFVLVRGQKAPVVGRVTMDQIMVDVGHIKDAKLGDEVVLIGRKGTSRMSAEEIARVSRTIPYEIVCSITNRVPRVYKGM